MLESTSQKSLGKMLPTVSVCLYETIYKSFYNYNKLSKTAKQNIQMLFGQCNKGNTRRKINFCEFFIPKEDKLIITQHFIWRFSVKMKCTILPFLSWHLHTQSFVWKAFTLSYTDVMNLFFPWRFNFNSIKCVVISAIHARSIINFALLMPDTSCSFISSQQYRLENCASSFEWVNRTNWAS
jgi:hypothetical protein